MGKMLTTESVKTAARYLDRQGKRYFNEDGSPMQGDHLEADNTIIRYRDGYIHAEGEPAVECTDAHMEFWKDGYLHRDDNQPAIISDYGKEQEYWLYGEQINK